MDAAALFERAEYQFYAALARAALGDAAPAEERHEHLEALAATTASSRSGRAIARRISRTAPRWSAPRSPASKAASSTPSGFTSRPSASARANSFVHNEAIAYERASAFYRRARVRPVRRDVLVEGSRTVTPAGEPMARCGNSIRPIRISGRSEPGPGPLSTIGAPVEHLDLATVIKVLQAVSGEIVLEKLLDTLMRTALEQAGAERGLLILPRGDEQRIEAEATTSGDTVIVRLAEQSMAAATLPESIVNYVIRTQESVLLDDASAPNAFAADASIGAQHARSILCVPLINQAKLTGVLYLENTLTPHVFTPTRSAVLTLLASQAAISLENARLYAERQRDAAALREQANLLSLTHDAIFVRAMDGVVTYWNRGAEALYGWTTAQAVGKVTHDLLKTVFPLPLEQIEAAMLSAGRWEGELVHTKQDGTQVVVASRWSVQWDEWGAPVAILVTNNDITERQRAEEALHLAQAELAHVTRVATLGELTASIAHEINQPLGAVVNNASACVRWLAAQNLPEARRSAALVVADGHRAADIIHRLRTLAQKAPPQKDWLDLNATIREVLALATERSATPRGRVRGAPRSRCAADLGRPRPGAASAAQSADERHRSPE